MLLQKLNKKTVLQTGQILKKTINIDNFKKIKFIVFKNLKNHKLIKQNKTIPILKTKFKKSKVMKSKKKSNKIKIKKKLI